MRSKPQFFPPQVPGRRELPTYRSFKAHSENLLMGVGFQILNHADHESLCSTEYLCAGAMAYVSSLNEPVVLRDMNDLLYARDTLGFGFGFYISGSGFTKPAIDAADSSQLFVFELSRQGEFFPRTELSGLLTTMGAPAMLYGMERGTEEIVDIIARMYPTTRPG